MTKRRLFSSDEIIRAMLRCGFELSGRAGKNHQGLRRRRPDGRHDVTSVPIGEREIPKGTFDNILKLAGLDYDEFLEGARIKRKGRKRKK